MLRSSCDDCKNTVVEVFAHIGDVTLQLTGKSGGSRELPTLSSEGKWMLKVIPEVGARIEELQQVFKTAVILCNAKRCLGEVSQVLR